MAHLSFGSVPAAIAYLRGERISISPRLADLGAAPAGGMREVTVHISNWADVPVRLIGGTADCSCTVLHDLPLEIGPGEARPVTVSVRMAGEPGVFTRSAGFVIDDQGIKRIDFRLTGRVHQAQPNGQASAQ